MKAKVPYFWALYFFSRSEFGIMPKNEANHSRTGDFETIYFPFLETLILLVIDSTACAPATQRVYGCYNSLRMPISGPNAIHIEQTSL